MGGERLITTDAIAERLVVFVGAMVVSRPGAAITIPVLEANGAVAEHTLLLSPGTNLDLVDVDGPEADAARFPMPTFPAVGAAAMPVSDPSAAATIPDGYLDGKP